VTTHGLLSNREMTADSQAQGRSYNRRVQKDVACEPTIFATTPDGYTHNPVNI
jgi:hypothetical protein